MSINHHSTTPWQDYQIVASTRPRKNPDEEKRLLQITFLSGEGPRELVDEYPVKFDSMRQAQKWIDAHKHLYSDRGSEKLDFRIQWEDADYSGTMLVYGKDNPYHDECWENSLARHVISRCAAQLITPPFSEKYRLSQDHQELLKDILANKYEGIEVEWWGIQGTSAVIAVPAETAEKTARGMRNIIHRVAKENRAMVYQDLGLQVSSQDLAKIRWAREIQVEPLSEGKKVMRVQRGLGKGPRMRG